MSEADGITLSATDDEELEILDEKITNFGGALAQPKQLELSKDEEKKILDSLRKQNMSIPEGDFKLKMGVTSTLAPWTCPQSLILLYQSKTNYPRV